MGWPKGSGCFFNVMSGDDDDEQKIKLKDTYDSWSAASQLFHIILECLILFLNNFK